MGAATNISHITVTNGLGTQYTATGNNNSVSVNLQSGALPDSTALDIYLLNDPAASQNAISGTNSFIVSLVVSWLASDGTVPTTAAGKPLVVTVNNAAIKQGALIYQLIGGVAQLVGAASQDGSAQVSITDDPELVIVATVPSAPTQVSAVAGNASAVVSWTSSTSTGGADITSYVVTASSGETCTTTLSSCEIAGLANGTAVTFTVSALNSIGNSVASSASSAVTPAAPVVRAPSGGAPSPPPTPTTPAPVPTTPSTPSTPAPTPNPSPAPTVTSASPANINILGFASASSALTAAIKKALRKIAGKIGKAKAVSISGLVPKSNVSSATVKLASARSNAAAAYLAGLIKSKSKATVKGKKATSTSGNASGIRVIVVY
jgi:outer membrane protein OmpA-like peptidoglycan-associated protein